MGGPRKNIAVAGMPFGKGVVIDPDVPVIERPAYKNGRPYTRRYARLVCEPRRGGCGTVYLAPLTRLFGDHTKSCTSCAYKRPRKTGGRVRAARNGWAVEVYVGFFKSRAEAEDVARRSRAVVLPETTPITGI